VKIFLTLAAGETAATKGGYDPKQMFKDFETALDQYKVAY
jgi:hypothetical protein